MSQILDIILISGDFFQNLYNIFAILGFLISSFLAISAFIKSRKNIKLQIIDCCIFNGKFLQLFILVQNNSSLPISISSFSFVCNSQLKPCYLLPKYPEGIDTKNPNMMTAQFPVNLSSGEGRHLVIEFPHCEGIQLAPDKRIALKVYSNRGAINLTSIELHKSHYLHTTD